MSVRKRSSWLECRGCDVGIAEGLRAPQLGNRGSVQLAERPHDRVGADRLPGTSGQCPGPVCVPVVGGHHGGIATKHTSTRLSHDADVGVKCTAMRGDWQLARL